VAVERLVTRCARDRCIEVAGPRLGCVAGRRLLGHGSPAQSTTLDRGGVPAGDDHPRPRILRLLDDQRQRPATVGLPDEQPAAPRLPAIPCSSKVRDDDVTAARELLRLVVRDRPVTERAERGVARKSSWTAGDDTL